MPLFKRILSLAKKHKVFAAVLIVGVLIVFFLTRSGFPTGSKTSYQTATVSKSTIVAAVSVSGQVATVGRLPVLSQASGQVREVYVKNGQSVVAGQKILSIILDPSASQKNASAWASYLSAQSQLSSANAKINSLQSALFKANQTFINDKGVPNPSDSQKSDPKYIEENADWLQAEADYKNQQAVIAASQASLASAWQNYQQTSPDLVAPISGTITDLTYVPGMLINSSISSSGITQSQTIASIVTPALPTLTANLSEADVNKVTEGNRVTVTFDALPDKTYTGKVVGVNKTGAVSSGVTNYPTTIQIDSAVPEILPNMSASAKIITATKTDVLTVPSEAVTVSNGLSSVQILRNGQPVALDVETGLTSDVATEIVSGLNEGEVVVTRTNSPTSSSTTTQSPFSTFRLGGGGGFGAAGQRGATGR